MQKVKPKRYNESQKDKALSDMREKAHCSSEERDTIRKEEVP